MNPYTVLGVSENATDEQIRQAYRDQARRCQQQIDAGVDADYAQQKMRELDEAYDAIILSRSAGTQGSYSYQSSYVAPSDFSDIRAKVRAGRLDDAQTLLDGIPQNERSAEWYFLKGCVQQRKGWLEEAVGNFAAACRMDPNNREYRSAYENIQNSGSGGYRTTRQSANKGSSACNLCAGLLCADTCCECMGGDLIACC